MRVPKPIVVLAMAAQHVVDLLYEASRFEPALGISVEVASPEDIEHCAHVRRTGTAPEIKIMRATPA